MAFSQTLARRSRHPYVVGIWLAIASFTFWVFGDSFVKVASVANLSPFTICAASGAIGTVLLVCYAAAKQDFGSLIPQTKGPQFLLALLSLGNNICNAVAMRHLSLTSYYIIIFTAPLIIAVLAHFFLHEKSGWKGSLCIVTGFIGAFVAMDPLSAHSAGDWIGYGATLLQAFFYSIGVIVSRKVAKSNTIESLVFTSALTTMFGGIALALFLGQPLLVADTRMLFAAAAGLVGIGGVALFYLSLRSAPATIVSPMHYTQIITGALISYFVWGTEPSLSAWAGCMLIVGSGLLFLRFTKDLGGIPEPQNGV